MKEADQLRAWMAKNPDSANIVGGVGGAEKLLLAVLDRLDELEWIVGVMRGKVNPDTSWLTSPSGEVGD